MDEVLNNVFIKYGDIVISVKTLIEMVVIIFLPKLLYYLYSLPLINILKNSLRTESD